MFFDLNVLLPTPTALTLSSTQSHKKGKQRQKALPGGQSTTANSPAPPALVFSLAQVAAIEARIDILVQLGYTVLALTQCVQSKVDSRTHVDWLQGLVPRLRKRQGVAILKRLTVLLDEDSDKGNGVNAQNDTLLSQYDILSLQPTTQTSFSQACLTHSTPSPQTSHIISMPVTLPRLPFHLKHTLIRTALKNGAVFEVAYAGAVGAETERRNWWGGARELMRVTKGKGVLLSGGTSEDREVRAPRDAANLVTLLGIPQNLSHAAVTQTAKSVVLRAQSRKTYRAVLSEPRLIVQPSGGNLGMEEPAPQQPAPQQPVLQPTAPQHPASQLESTMTPSGMSSTLSSPVSELPPSKAPDDSVSLSNQRQERSLSQPSQQLAVQKGQKRTREEDGCAAALAQLQHPQKKKKKKKN